MNALEFSRQFGETIVTLIAFVIFVWLMKKYAWGPLTNLLDERQRRIDQGFADIKQKQAAAADLERQYQAQLQNIEQERRTKIQEGIAEGRRVASEITETAREEADQNAQRSRRSLEIELEKTRVALRDEIVGMTVSATERLLRTNLNENEQRRLVSSFIEELERQPQA